MAGPGSGGGKRGGHMEVLVKEGAGFQFLHYENLLETSSRGVIQTINALEMITGWRVGHRAHDGGRTANWEVVELAQETSGGGRD